MIVETSYDLRDQKITAYYSYPEKTMRDISSTIENLWWVLKQKNPVVSIRAS